MLWRDGDIPHHLCMSGAGWDIPRHLCIWLWRDGDIPRHLVCLWRGGGAFRLGMEESLNLGSTQENLSMTVCRPALRLPQPCSDGRQSLAIRVAPVALPR